MKKKPPDFRNKDKIHSRGYIIVQSITLARIPLAIAFGVVLICIKSVNLAFWLGLILLIIIESTDAFDGHIARHFNLATEYGATLDPYADSISRLIVYWTLAANNLVLFLVPLCMAVRDVTVAYSRIILAKNNQSISAKFSGKAKAVVQATGAFLALFGPHYWNRIGDWSYYALSWIVITVTLLSTIEYALSAIRSYKNVTKKEY